MANPEDQIKTLHPRPSRGPQLQRSGRFSIRNPSPANKGATLPWIRGLAALRLYGSATSLPSSLSQNIRIFWGTGKSLYGEMPANLQSTNWDVRNGGNLRDLTHRHYRCINQSNYKQFAGKRQAASLLASETGLRATPAARWRGDRPSHPPFSRTQGELAVPGGWTVLRCSQCGCFR